MSSPKLDDLQCAFSSLCGFLESRESDSIPVHAVFDNEETGSMTKQGAASPFLRDTLERIADSLGLSHQEYLSRLPQSFMLSADNAHAFHPNYPEKCDPVNQPVMGGGVVLKHSGNQKYATDAASAAIADATAPADLEEAVAKFSGSAAEPALEIKLAKSYYDDGRYEEALARYEEMSGKVPPEFADIPVVGKAMCLEALKKFPEALEAFDGFVEANPKSYLALTAKLGAARCLAESGDSAKALERIEALKKECEGDEVAKSRVEAAENAIKRLAKEPKE